MRNIKYHKISLPGEIIEKCWDIYSRRFNEIEGNLLHYYSQGINCKITENIHCTGAFQIYNYDISKIYKDKLFNYFVLDKTHEMAIKMKTKIVFRGIDYFIGMRKESNVIKIRRIFKRLFEMIEISSIITSQSNHVLCLVLLDYIRNYLLLLLNLVHRFPKEIGIKEKMNNTYLALIRMINEVEFNYFYMLQKKSLFKPVLSLSKYRYMLERLCAITLEFFSTIEENNSSSVDYIRKFRECDHPLKLLQFARKIGKLHIPRNTVLIGLEYGAIELPFCLNAYRKIMKKSILKVITINLSIYSTRNVVTVQKLESVLSPFVDLEKFTNSESIMILDDSITTGRTIEKLIQLLPNSINNIYLGIVSFGNTKRYHHLIRYDHGSVNPIVLESSIVLFKSNYTKTYTKKRYTNKKGTFDKDKQRIIKLMKKNYPEYI